MEILQVTVLFIHIMTSQSLQKTLPYLVFGFGVYPECAIRGPSASTRVPNREVNCMGGPLLFNAGIPNR